MSFFPSSYVVIATKNESALLWYVGAYVVGYLGGKGADVFSTKRVGRKVKEED
jgi:hypothetical protein